MGELGLTWVWVGSTTQQPGGLDGTQEEEAGWYRHLLPASCLP
jgi:hypothetical protein